VVRHAVSGKACGGWPRLPRRAEALGARTLRTPTCRQREEVSRKACGGRATGCERWGCWVDDHDCCTARRHLGDTHR
jgi:hypothetical protein